MFNKILLALIFYGIAFLVIFLLNKLSPNAHDGGLGFGGMAVLLLPLIGLVLMGLNIYWGITIEKQYFIIAGIHFIAVLIILIRFFL
jgi:hypothetical protein